MPAVNELNWFKSLGNEWTSNGRATLIRDAKYGAEMLHVEWTDAEKSPVVEVTSRIATRDRAIDFAKPSRPAPLSAAELEINTKGTELLIPVDGIVKQASDKIVTKADAKTDIEKARAIYEWIVDNTFRDARVGGCGIGDIAAILKSGNLAGKCADLNALFVGLVRAAGIPARDIYGIRLGPSAVAALVPARKPSLTRSTAARKSFWRGMGGSLLTLRMCGKLCSKRRRAIWRSMIPGLQLRARLCSALGRQLARIQFCSRHRAGRIEWSQGRISNVSPGRVWERAARLPRPGYLQICHYCEGADLGVRQARDVMQVRCFPGAVI